MKKFKSFKSCKSRLITPHTPQVAFIVFYCSLTNDRGDPGMKPCEMTKTDENCRKVVVTLGGLLYKLCVCVCLYRYG